MPTVSIEQGTSSVASTNTQATSTTDFDDGDDGINRNGNSSGISDEVATILIVLSVMIGIVVIIATIKIYTIKKTNYQLKNMWKQQNIANEYQTNSTTNGNDKKTSELPNLDVEMGNIDNPTTIATVTATATSTHRNSVHDVDGDDDGEGDDMGQEINTEIGDGIQETQPPIKLKKSNDGIGMYESIGV